MGAWKRFLAPYYVVNALVVLSYLIVRHFHPKSTLRAVNDSFMSLTRESEIVLIACVAVAQRWYKSTTTDEWVGSLILFSKTTVIVLLYMTNVAIMGWYLVAYLLMFFTLKRRRFDGDRNVEVLTPVTLSTRIEHGNKAEAWLVFFRAAWSGASDNFDPVFADLSLKYRTKNMKFGEIDIARWPEAAKKFDIDTSATSLQVPSLILFEQGKEHRRLPPIQGDGSVKAVKLDREGVIKHFYLERRLLDQFDYPRS